MRNASTNSRDATTLRPIVLKSRLGAARRAAHHEDVFWRRSEPPVEAPLDREDVLEIFWALANIRANTLTILSILRGEDEEEEETDS